MDAPLNKAQEVASFLVSWARTVLKWLLVSWYTNLNKETIHLATEFVETGLQTPFWYVSYIRDSQEAVLGGG
jgi:hypothetical protein